MQCERDCFRRGTGTPGYDEGARAALCCALPDYDTRNWTSTTHDDAPPRYMGDAPLYHLEGIRRDWQRPKVDPKETGCFAAYWRSEFIGSLLRYHRARTDTGDRVSNPFHDRCTDRFVLEAVDYLESVEDAAHSEFTEAVDKARIQAIQSRKG